MTIGGDHTDIQINVHGQKLKTVTDLTVVSGTKDFIRFIFALPSDWKALKPNLYAQFIQSENIYSKKLDDNDAVYLPSEIEPGTCSLMLYGTSTDTIGTSNFLTITISESIYIW